jgi:hypothetical protein
VGWDAIAKFEVVLNNKCLKLTFMLSMDVILMIEIITLVIWYAQFSSYIMICSSFACSRKKIWHARRSSNLIFSGANILSRFHGSYE